MAYSYHKFAMPKKCADKSWGRYYENIKSFNDEARKAVIARLSLRVAVLINQLSVTNVRNRANILKI